MTMIYGFQSKKERLRQATNLVLDTDVALNPLRASKIDISPEFRYRIVALRGYMIRVLRGEH